MTRLGHTPYQSCDSACGTQNHSRLLKTKATILVQFLHLQRRASPILACREGDRLSTTKPTHPQGSTWRPICCCLISPNLLTRKNGQKDQMGTDVQLFTDSGILGSGVVAGSGTLPGLGQPPTSLCSYGRPVSYSSIKGPLIWMVGFLRSRGL